MASHPRLRRLQLCEGIVFLLLLFAGDGHAETPDWLLGAWSGTATVGKATVQSTLVLRDESGTVRWTWTAGGPGIAAVEAEGTVTASMGSYVRLEGRYTATS